MSVIDKIKTIFIKDKSGNNCLTYKERKKRGAIGYYNKNIDLSIEKSLYSYKENRALQTEVISDKTGIYANYNTKDFLDAYSVVSWIYACTKVKAQAIASLPINVYIKNSNGDLVDITNNTKVKFLQKPNSYQSKFEFFERLQSFIELTGEGFISFYPNKKNPENMYVLRSDYVKVYLDNKGYISKYQYVCNGKVVDYTTDEILYIKSFNPLSEIRGLSQLSSGINSILLELDSVAYMKSTFDNGGFFSGAFKFPQGVSEDDRDRIENMVKQKYSGRDKSNQILFLYGGVDFVPFSMNAKDMEFLEQRQYSLKEILAIYNVPPLSVGIFESMSYANADVQMRLFWENLKPEAFRISDSIENDILKNIFNENVVCEFDFSGIDALKENETEKENRLRGRLQAGVITINEYRKEIGLEPFNSDTANSLLLGFGVMPVSEGKSENTQEETIPLKQYIYQKDFTDYDNDVIIKGILSNRKLLKNQNAFQKKIQDLLKQQKEEVEKKLLNEINISYGNKVLGAGMVLFDIDEWVKKFYEAGYPHIAFAIEQASKNMLNNLPTSVEYMQSERVLTELRNRAMLYSNELLQTNSEQLNLIVADLQREIERNTSIDEISKMVNDRLNGLYGIHTQYRANLIARTEIVSATNFGNLEGMRQSGIKGLKKRWITSRDDKVRDSHKIDGQVKELDEEFVLADGRKMLYPSDFNERCTTIPVIE